MSAQEISSKAASLQPLIAALQGCGTVVSAMVQLDRWIRLPDKTAPSGFFREIMELLSLDGSELGEVRSELCTVKVPLNRFEFEGSLIAVLRQGGCHAIGALPREQASALVSGAMQDAFPEEWYDIRAYRQDDPMWSDMTRDYALSVAYLACISRRGAPPIWWLLCVAEDD